MTKMPPNERGTREIDQNLRRVYEQVVSEGVPDRFNELLKKLRQGEIPPSTSMEEGE